MNTKNLLIMLSALLVGVTIGLGATLIVKKILSEGEKAVPVSPSPTTHSSVLPQNATTIPEEDNKETEQQPEKEKNIEIIYSQPQKEGKSYSVSVYAKHVPEGVVAVYRLTRPGATKGFESKDGRFIDIPATPQGSYEIFVVDEANSNVLASDKISGFDADKEVEKMTISQIQTLILNQHDASLLGGKNPKVAKNLVIKIVQIREDERRPDDIQSVRDKIANGIWESAKVISVTYDELGRINSVTISPVYSNNE